MPVIQNRRTVLDQSGKPITIGFNSQNIPLIQILSEYDENGEKKYSYSLLDKDRIILSSYWSDLSKQAVLHSAGVIKLFFDEVEKEKRTGVLAEKNKSLFSKALDSTLAFVGLAKPKATTTNLTVATSTVTSTNVQTNNSVDTDYLKVRLRELQDQLRAAQLAIDPSADWPPVGNVCSAQ